ncbi:OmpA family protein [Actimicrobium sp. CCI2.3]|uniref:OmpA family protein n=1 Tax=Actimicrobium sp. CCI2.3 TaxID=3048616 RepID=UPI002AB4335E|nr:OmpA family protein [Actimicrobium sp. CCI2.3]MDY7574434.1 OmpA family protein [Actimicrobium sp. CCI2.3]MEB0022488.1 OmpA family protein [Actimicrobium sp. CCI2.3]
MIRHAIFLMPLCLSLSAAIAVAGCAIEPKKTSAMYRTRPAVMPVRIEQLAFGPHAVYVQCIAQTCLTPTPKTAIETRAAEPVTTIEELSIGFPTGGAVLTSEARNALRDKLAVARAASHIVIRGRTDNAGSPAANARLALRRAVAVRDYLLRHEVPALTIFRIDAQGACCYVADNDSASGRTRNRRVEVVFVTSANNATGA